MNPSTDDSRNLFERYRPWERRVLVAAWIAIMVVQGAFNSVVAVIDARAAGRGLPAWQPVTWEVSSQLVLLLLVPAVIAFERRFPLGLSTLRKNLPWHLAASVLFSLVHVLAMVGLRHLVHSAMGAPYDFGDWRARWPYEYLKDVRTYALLIAAVLSYRLFMLRVQGEARVLDAPEPAPDAAPPAEPTAPQPRPERFLVRKLRREFLIAAGDIDWLQAQGNYVGLHVNGHDYLLRATLTDFLAQLDPSRFARVHRSHAVNLDRIREIEALDSGDARLHMHDGTVVPCSRRYRPGHNALSGR